MILSHKYKAIFIHIPRTSGTILTKTFNDDLYQLQSKYFNRNEVKHLKASQIRELVGDDIWSNYYKFTIIRNPWERILSRYMMYWLKDIEAISFHSLKSVNYFLKHDNGQLTPWEQGITCCDYLDQEIDYICRYESRYADLCHVFREIGYPINSAMAQNNQSLSSSQRHRLLRLTGLGEFDREANAIVEHRYKDDIERFGYTNKDIAKYAIGYK